MININEKVEWHHIFAKKDKVPLILFREAINTQNKSSVNKREKQIHSMYLLFFAKKMKKTVLSIES